VIASRSGLRNQVWNNYRFNPASQSLIKKTTNHAENHSENQSYTPIPSSHINFFDGDDLEIL